MAMEEDTLSKLVDAGKQELREDEETRGQALRAFREWIEKNPDISNCRTDDNFLLSFLRKRKFSVPMAERTLINFLKFTHNFRHLTTNFDIFSPALTNLIDSGHMFASPFRDDKGRQVVIVIYEKLDPHTLTFEDMFKLLYVTILTQMADEATQVLGYVYLLDAGNIGLAHTALFSSLDAPRLIRAMEKGNITRPKEVHILNLPGVAKVLVDLVKKCSIAKMRDSYMVHDSLDELHQYVSPRCLPKEYGGVIPISEMVDAWKKVLLANRGMATAAGNISILQTEDEESMIVGSFRKLTVD